MRSDGTAVALAVRDAALLAWLALEVPTPRARLAALLWPDSEAAAARNALRQRLFTLRKTLGCLPNLPGAGENLDQAHRFGQPPGEGCELRTGVREICH